MYVIVMYKVNTAFSLSDLFLNVQVLVDLLKLRRKNIEGILFIIRG